MAANDRPFSISPATHFAWAGAEGAQKLCLPGRNP